MKKTVILALSMAMPAMAGTPAPVVAVPAPASVAAPAKPADPSSDQEYTATYKFAARDLYSVGKSVDTYGIERTAIHRLTPNHGITVQVGYTYGSEVFRLTPDSRMRDQVETVSFMPGYRYTGELSDTVNIYVGANVGAARMRVDERISEPHWQGADNDSDWGIAYALELGVTKKVSDKVYAFAAYQFSGSTAKPDVWGDGENIHQQVYHGIRAGLYLNF